jgi:hypothetical protein
MRDRRPLAAQVAVALDDPREARRNAVRDPAVSRHFAHACVAHAPPAAPPSTKVGPCRVDLGADRDVGERELFDRLAALAARLEQSPVATSAQNL